MKIEIEKLSPSVFLKEEGGIGCVLFERDGDLNGWFIDKMMAYSCMRAGWLAREASAEDFAGKIYGIPGEFLE